MLDRALLERALILLYSRANGITLQYAAKLLGVRPEVLRPHLDYLVQLGYLVKQGKFYRKRLNKRVRTIHRKLMSDLERMLPA